ncbi:MAG: hypothetical protein INR68_05435 [Methylobacterium mesophilicum]|nr:hypothetical protein [Methylobacterium mesophilicum]
MRLQAAIQGDLKHLMQQELTAAETAVTAGVRDATGALKTALRRQVTGAGLGSRLANTWRGQTFPSGQKSLEAAGFVWSKAPTLIGAYDQGATIRSSRGFYLAIPLPAAGRYGRGRAKITPGLWERTTGIRLRFVYRRGAPSLLVADNAKLNRSGRARANVGRRDGAVFTRLAGRSTIPVFLLVPQVRVAKRLDVAGAAQEAAGQLPTAIMRHWREPDR